MIDRAALAKEMGFWESEGMTLDEAVNNPMHFPLHHHAKMLWEAKIREHPASAARVGRTAFMWAAGDWPALSKRVDRSKIRNLAHFGKRGSRSDLFPMACPHPRYPPRGVRKARGAFTVRTQEDMRRLVEDSIRQMRDDKARAVEIAARRERKSLRRARRDAHNAHVAALRAARASNDV